MKIFLIIFCLLALETLPVRAQGTLVFDQQSATNDNFANFSRLVITYKSIGQSFTPTLSGIDFVRLRMTSASPLSPGATLSGAVYVNLWAGGISNGVLLAATAPVNINLSLPFASVVYANFLFSSSVSLTPGTTYFLQPVELPQVQIFDFGIFAPPFNGNPYPGGTAFFNATASPFYDLWFREGVVVTPEPSPAHLLLVAMIGFTTFRHKIKPG